MGRVKTVLMLVSIITLVTMIFTACSSDSLAKTVGITAPGSLGADYDWDCPHCLAVRLKPGTAVAGVEYKVVLYKKGAREDESYVEWNADEINAKTVKVVHFPLSDSEYSAYSISTGPQTDPKTHAYLGIGYKDLGDTFTVTVEESK